MKFSDVPEGTFEKSFFVVLGSKEVASVLYKQTEREIKKVEISPVGRAKTVKTDLRFDPETEVQCVTLRETVQCWVEK